MPGITNPPNIPFPFALFELINCAEEIIANLAPVGIIIGWQGSGVVAGGAETGMQLKYGVHSVCDESGSGLNMASWVRLTLLYLK